jgi:type IV secretion system protein VirB3
MVGYLFPWLSLKQSAKSGMHMKIDVVFRGCTRPPMFFGIPMVPFMIVVMAGALLAFYINLLIFFVIPIVLAVMRDMTRKDEAIFELLGVRLQLAPKLRRCKKTQDQSIFISPA